MGTVTVWSVVRQAPFAYNDFDVNCTAAVRVVAHPMETGSYWVQPNVSVKTDGTWKVIIYIGRPGDVDVGKQFEIMAVANPKISLKEGDVLDEWPDAEFKSQVVEVTRE